jgi:amino acid transporter
VMWAFARADVLPGSGFLRKLSVSQRLPVNTIMTTGVIAAVLLVSTQSEDVYLTLVSMATGGFYISFAMPVIGALITRLKGRWVPGAWTLGSWGMIVTVVASIWVVFEYFNIAWPRAEGVPWYQDWAVFVMTGIIGALGVIAYLVVRPRVQAAEDRLEEDPSSVVWTTPETEAQRPS